MKVGSAYDLTVNSLLLQQLDVNKKEISLSTMYHSSPLHRHHSFNPSNLTICPLSATIIYYPSSTIHYLLYPLLKYITTAVNIFLLVEVYPFIFMLTLDIIADD